MKCKCISRRGRGRGATLDNIIIFIRISLTFKYDHLQDKMSVGGIWDISTPPSDI